MANEPIDYRVINRVHQSFTGRRAYQRNSGPELSGHSAQGTRCELRKRARSRWKGRRSHRQYGRSPSSPERSGSRRARVTHVKSCSERSGSLSQPSATRQRQSHRRKSMGVLLSSGSRLDGSQTTCSTSRFVILSCGVPLRVLSGRENPYRARLGEVPVPKVDGRIATPYL